MADREFQTLSVQSQRDALITAERASNQNAFLLEKDIWVVATLRALFSASFGEHLIFKGGTRFPRYGERFIDFRKILISPTTFDLWSQP